MVHFRWAYSATIFNSLKSNTGRKGRRVGFGKMSPGFVEDNYPWKRCRSGLGLTDAELQLITGHARRETLAVYQHVALDGELKGKYQEAMGKWGCKATATVINSSDRIEN
jgi:hypothetical protein